MHGSRWGLAGVGMVWVATIGLLVISSGDAEGWLEQAFAGRAMPDAFQHVNEAFGVFWVGLSWMLVLGLVAERRGRGDVAAVVLMGPGFSLGICLVFENWRDPNWHNILAIMFFGCLVGMVVGTGYWIVKRRKAEVAEIEACLRG